MAVVYSAGVVIGGLAQAIVTELIRVTGHPESPGIYILACSMLSMVGLWLLTEVRGAGLVRR